MNNQPLWRLIFISIVVLMISIVIAAIVGNVSGVKPVSNSGDLFFYEMAMLVFIAPILEELTFRYPCSFKKNHLITGVVTGWLLLVLDFDKLLEFLFSWMNVVAVLGSVIWILILKKTISKLVLNYLILNRNTMFYLLAILFSIGHIKWELGFISVLVTPFLLLPAFSFGVVMINFRLKYNVLTAILIHGFINGLFLLKYV